MLHTIMAMMMVLCSGGPAEVYYWAHPAPPQRVPMVTQGYVGTGSSLAAGSAGSSAGPRADRLRSGSLASGDVLDDVVAACADRIAPGVHGICSGS